MVSLYLTMIDNDTDREAFNNLVKTYERKLFNLAYSILGDKDLAEEALWDSFFKLAKSYYNFNNLPVYKIEAYMVITIKRTSYSIYDREKKYSDMKEYDEEFPEQSDMGGLDEYSVSELASAINELDEKHKAVIAYIYYYGHSADETAQIMGISRSAVYKYLSQAKNSLAQKLRGDIDE